MTQGIVLAGLNSMCLIYFELLNSPVIERPKFTSIAHSITGNVVITLKQMPRCVSV